MSLEIIYPNKDIIVRAWHKEKKKMYDVFEFLSQKTNHVGDKDRLVMLNDFGCDISEVILMLYIRLEDKNDKKIFEGDLIKYYGDHIPQYQDEDTIYEIEYGLNEFYGTPVYLKYHCGDYCGGSHLRDFLLPRDREIIGNKFENPELLKE